MRNTDKKHFYYKKSLAALEFDKVCQILSDYAAIDKTVSIIKNIVPLYNSGCVKRQLAEVSQAKSMLELNQRLPLGNLSEDVDLYIQKSVKGLTLTQSEFIQVAKLIKISGDMSKYHQNSSVNTDCLDVLFERLFCENTLYNRITKTFPDGERIADDATPELYRIRRKIASAMQKVKDMLDDYIKKSEVAPHLQDSIVTIRYDRFVIPVKSDNRGNIKGLVHDTSNTGSTLFVEPLFVIEENNNIRKLENEERQEIEKILKELTELVAINAPLLQMSYKSLVSLDYIFAKARYSYQNNMIEPKIAGKKTIDVKFAKHPLISKDVMVPLTFKIGDGIDTVIVTGPNTGGKTVFLKTMGLFCLMAKAGMHLPCDDATIYVFDKIYADIGDEQSIEQSLSTFSSHLKNIKNILSNITSESFVLFDELGGGTDPLEGAALAEAIIEKVRKNGAFAACTTHYNELKTYALETEGVINASFEFDLESLSPTYKLGLGIPGKSYAFEISKHLGIADEIIDYAKTLISDDVKRFDRVVEQLNNSKVEYDKLKDELVSKELELNLKLKEANDKISKIEKNSERELDNARQKARQLVEKARHDSHLFLEELKKQKDFLDKASALTIKTAVKRGVAALDSDDYYSAPKQVETGKPLGNNAAVGKRVFVAKLSKEGEIVSIAGNSARVNCAGLVVNVKLNELYEPEAPKQQKPEKSTVRFERSLNRSVKMELDIRGQMVADACELIDRFIDDAILDKLSTVTIIHGKGTGALRAGVHSHLKTHRCVKKFNLGAYGEGDSGVTVVELK